MKNHSRDTIFVPSQDGYPTKKEFKSLGKAAKWGAKHLDVTAENITADDEKDWFEIKDFSVVEWKPGKHFEDCDEYELEWDCKRKKFRNEDV